MLTTRVIPALLLRDGRLVKTVRFGDFRYVGDPCNTVRIFNELEADELLLLDITATSAGRPPNLKLLGDIANECFMPVAYGGGVRTVEQARDILQLGFEKVVINSYALVNPMFITDLANLFGSQAVVLSIDVKTNMFGRPHVWSHAERKSARRDPVVWARECESLGAGELLLTSVDREGTWAGFDIQLVRRVVDAVSIPVIAHGGGSTVDDARQVVDVARASAVALGSMVVFQKRDMGVLVNMPIEIRSAFS